MGAMEMHLSTIASVLQKLCEYNDNTTDNNNSNNNNNNKQDFREPSTSPSRSTSWSDFSYGTSPAMSTSSASTSSASPSFDCSTSDCSSTPVSTPSTTPRNNFQGLRAPTISVYDFLFRIYRYAGCSDTVLILALIYVDRLIQEDFVSLNSMTVHRLLIAAVCVAAKFFDDVHYSNTHYAKVGGVGLEEFNLLETQLLFALRFSLHVDPKTYNDYLRQMLGSKYKQDDPALDFKGDSIHDTAVQETREDNQKSLDVASSRSRSKSRRRRNGRWRGGSRGPSNSRGKRAFGAEKYSSSSTKRAPRNDRHSKNREGPGHKKNKEKTGKTNPMPISPASVRPHDRPRSKSARGRRWKFKSEPRSKENRVQN